MSAKTLTSLLNMIKQVFDDETSKRHKEKLQQKIIIAIQTFFVKNAFLENRNQFLTKINDESKVRRSIKSKTLEKTRMMSFENLEKTRAKRVVKETAKETKKTAKEIKKNAKKIKKLVIVIERKRDRKCKNEKEANALKLKINVARTSEAQIENEITSQS